jgi:hypothetical protein
MAGRFAYFLVGGAAIVTGMIVQGDIDLGSDHQGHNRIVKVSSGGDGEIDRTVDRIVDRATDKIVIDGDDGRVFATDPATKRALAEAVKELVRAEASLIAARMDDDMPAAAINQAEQRRDLAKQAVDRIANDAKADTRGNRDALRQNIRDEVRGAVRN